MYNSHLLSLPWERMERSRDVLYYKRTQGQREVMSAVKREHLAMQQQGQDVLEQTRMI